MEYLHEKCTEVSVAVIVSKKDVLKRKYNSLQTLHETMCEDTVFWDLNYAIKYKSLGTEEIRSKVLKVLEKLSVILRNKLIKLNLKMRENRI